jgi:SsrA-binding protein
LAIKIVCQNKKARHDYFIEETFEAGICLQGSEVKSLRLGKANLRDCYARVHGGEIFLVGAHITPYKQADTFAHVDPTRTRKLLLHKREIDKLIGLIQQKGYTLIATKIYFKNGKVKVELGLGKGKKLHDKRETLKRQEAKRDMDRAIKERKGGG